jgi:hypothetical protein
MTFELPQNTRTPVRVRESIVAGVVPTVLAEGEVAVNSTDGVLFCQSVAGVVQAFPSAVGINRIESLTQAAYDALTPVATTLYVVTPNP